MPLGKKSLFYRLTHFDLSDGPTQFILLICSVPLIFLVLIQLGVVDRDYLVVLPIFSIWVILPVVFVAKQNYYSEATRLFDGFAKTNGWNVTRPHELASLLPPSLLRYRAKWSSDASRIVDVDLNHHRFELVRLVSTDEKKNVTKDAYLVRYPLPRPLPYVVLDNRKLTASFSDFSSGLQETALESNFPDHYRLLHAPNDQINALSLLTPDVMAAVLDSATSYEIEINGNCLYFYSFWDDSGEEGVRSLFQAVDKIAPEILHKAKTARL